MEVYLIQDQDGLINLIDFYSERLKVFKQKIRSLVRTQRSLTI